MIQCIAADKVFCNSSGFSTPRYFVASACESASISSTRLPCRASATLRDTAVVVFPTPPFWFEIAMVFHFRSSQSSLSLLAPTTMQAYPMKAINRPAATSSQFKTFTALSPFPVPASFAKARYSPSRHAGYSFPPNIPAQHILLQPGGMFPPALSLSVHILRCVTPGCDFKKVSMGSIERPSRER